MEPVIDTQPQQSETVDRDFNRLFDFERAKERLHNLIKEWAEEKKCTMERRNIRDIEVDMEQMHANRELKNDEVLIPVRVIDENIREEQPQYVNFVSQSRRLLIFKDQQEHHLSFEDIEEFFTVGMRYKNWLVPWIKVIDGAQMHGWDALEIEFDEEMPFQLKLSHIGHENLIFDLKKTENLEDNEEILRVYNLTTHAFETMAKKLGFNASLVKDVVDKNRSKETNEEIIKIYKRWHKFQDTVYVSWFLDKECEYDYAWLREPKPLILGDATLERTTVEQPINTTGPDGIPIMAMTTVPVMSVQKKPESTYPIKLCVYTEGEGCKLRDKKGRVFYDQPKQEAEIALWSLYITGSIRASNVYSSPAETNVLNSGEALQKLEINLEGGCVYNKKMDFWSPDYPSFDTVRAANALNSRGKAERGSFASAVMNREDSRKTAKELGLAEEKEISLSSVQVTSFSMFVASVYDHCVRLVRGLILQGLIQAPPNILQRFLGRKFHTIPAGDIDVVKRREKLNNRFNIWPMVATNQTLAQVFLMDILTEIFPEDAVKYQQAIQHDDMKMQMIQQLAAMLGAAMTDPQTGKARPDMQQFVPQIKQLEKALGISILQLNETKETAQGA